jgi:hypothetical protein
MARSWRETYQDERSKVFVGCPAPMEYDGGDLSDVGVVQIVNSAFNERFEGMRWMLHPTGCFGKDDWILCVEADSAFFGKPTVDDLMPNAACLTGCAYFILKALDHDRFISLLQGISVSSACNEHRKPRYDLEKYAWGILNSYTDIFSQNTMKKNLITRLNRDAGWNFDEMVYVEGLEIAKTIMKIQFRDILWTWCGESRNKFDHDPSDILRASKYQDHVAWAKSLFPHAGVVHFQGAEMAYVGRSKGRFIR